MHALLTPPLDYVPAQGSSSSGVNRRVIAKPFFCDDCSTPTLVHAHNYVPARKHLEEQYQHLTDEELADKDSTITQVRDAKVDNEASAVLAFLLDARPLADACPRADSTLRR